MNKKLVKVSFVFASLGITLEIIKRGCVAYKRKHPQSQKIICVTQAASTMLKGLSLITGTSIGVAAINNFMFREGK